ncbi:S-adenosyl-L-methionine-dependent methyltransferase [Pilaira anomala]|nr:S-adenosyl-L-methionine-dependent methyltransferase [Pilaira anomala]
MTNNNLNRIGLSLGSTPSSPIPIPNIAPDKTRRVEKDIRFVTTPITTTVAKKSSVEMSDAQVNEIVDMLGVILMKVKQAISDKKDTYAPSAAVTFLLRRMDVNTQDLLSEDLYCLMTGFMTVYVSFIQEVFLHKFKDFMRLFSSHDSLLNGKEDDNDQPFLWLYLSYDRSNNLSILNDLHKQLLPKRYDASFILSRIDAIFSKFYTTHFLEAYVQKHQKDHGQFYTPQPIIQFMWDKCATLPLLTQHLREKTTMLRVFDPCLGMGSFLCEFLTRFIKACKSTVWNNPVKLTTLLARDIPDHIWGIEIDPFAYQLCKINMMVHLFPLYERLKELGVDLKPGMINRLRLFCNDSLKLREDTNPFISDTANQMDPFEKACLKALRNASQKFDFIVTNPPYIIRKTGYVAQPDPVIYDEEKLGGRGSQAYLYFMWVALQRCDDATGQICLVTPSQWTVLEFAQHIREWIWKNCKLLDMYEFEPYKVWPKVQTDSLVFRICKRTTTLPNTDHTLYVRNTSRKISLVELLDLYQKFDPNNPTTNKDIKFKLAPLDESNRILTSKHASFAFVLPTASCLEELNTITAHLPRLCDGEQNRSGDDSPSSEPTPLNWNRGPNTNPVYSLVVRTSWAREAFGEEACERWLKPCFYWNGKTISSSTGGGKEGEFWRDRDPLRLSRKEMSAAEAYWPYCNLDTENPEISFYSMIMVNKEDADKLKKEFDEYGQGSPIASLYTYLRDAREALQGDKKDKEIAHCQYNKCGTEVPVKIIHPINCGYYTRSQPRQRFFVDKTRVAVTNQCIYFTIKPDYPWQDADYYCGLLNSTLLQFFSKVHCCYDQQGRMRFFGRLMAYIPFAPPPSVEFMDHMATFVQAMTEARTWIYSFVRHTPNGQRLMERIRNCEWHLSSAEIEVVRQFCPPEDWILQPDTSLSTFTCPSHLEWISEIVTRDHLTSKRVVVDVFTKLLKVTSLFQFAIDQMIYHIYNIPTHLQLDVEADLNLQGLRKEWEGKSELIYSDHDPQDWFDRVMEIAVSVSHEKSEHVDPVTTHAANATVVGSVIATAIDTIDAARHKKRASSISIENSISKRHCGHETDLSQPIYTYGSIDPTSIGETSATTTTTNNNHTTTTITTTNLTTIQTNFTTPTGDMDSHSETTTTSPGSQSPHTESTITNKTKDIISTDTTNITQNTLTKKKLMLAEED